MRITSKRVLLAAVSVVGVGVVGSVVASPGTYNTPASPPTVAPVVVSETPPSPATGPSGVVVSRVVDADTFKVGDTTIRVLGVQAPEAGTAAGDQATAWATHILDGQTVRLEADPSQPGTDRYGRTLAHVYLSDGTNYGQQLIGQGWATEYTVGRAHRYQGLFRNTQTAAKGEGNGMWALRAAPVPSETVGAVRYASCAEAREAGVTPLHEGDPGYRSGLDGDRDGVACE